MVTSKMITNGDTVQIIPIGSLNDNTSLTSLFSRNHLYIWEMAEWEIHLIDVQQTQGYHFSMD